MTTYHAPVNETDFVLFDVLDIRQYSHLEPFGELSREFVGDVLDQVATFSEKTLHPLNQVGDRYGSTRRPDGSVSTPPGFPDAYRKFVADGWPGAAGPVEFGGGGLPHVVGFAFLEYLWAANPGFAMHASHLGHVALLAAHGTDEQRTRYAPHLVAGDWTGAMALSEPQAGTDLGLIRTRAVPDSDGSYRIAGTKVFTSGGDHDLSVNIVHFVLARLENAPAGTKGISLFLVPKLLLDNDGSPGPRNQFSCIGVEHKMGIHASPTCVMNYDEATGFLIGEPDHGLAAMFVLMNHMRLMTAVQALGISEIAYQNAARYAKDRRQGRALTGPRDPDESADPIIALPDVRRLLLGIRSFNEAARALLLFVALQVDLSEHAIGPAERRAAGDLAALLGPVIKGLFAEQAYENTVDAQRVFGGYGYITETGVEQFVRDVRVAAIGEGVTPVQAMDLVRRKIGLNQGETLAGFLRQVAATVGDDRHSARAAFTEPLRHALADLEAATEWITGAMRDDPDAVGAAAVDYLHLFGRVALGWMWVRMVDAVLEAPDTGATGPYPAKLTLARYYLDRLPAETTLRLVRMRHGAAGLMELDDQHF